MTKKELYVAAVQYRERAIELCADDNNEGICLGCGAERSGCEPDARKYTCEECEHPRKFKLKKTHAIK